MNELPIELIAGDLAPDPKTEVAFLVDGVSVLYSRFHSRATKEPESAITRLIEGIYARKPEMARKLLRHRIYSTAQATEMCWGMVKVAAKRLTPGILRAKSQGELPLEKVEVSPPAFDENVPLQPLPHESPMDFAHRLAAETRRLGNLYERDRPVGAVLVSEDGRILHHAINSNARFRTFHAEMNLVRSYFRETGMPLPAKSRIFTTLKPCKMCAGMIWQCSEDIHSMQIHFAEFDHGPMGRSTVLDPGSFERKRAESKS